MTVGALAAVAIFTVAVPAPASAAPGTLIVNGTEYDNPSGCFGSGQPKLLVQNDTDGEAALFGGPGCKGEEIDSVGPRDTGFNRAARSVRID
jgi:hypothetical protein